MSKLTKKIVATLILSAIISTTGMGSMFKFGHVGSSTVYAASTNIKFEQPISNGVYEFINVGSGKAFDLAGGNATNGQGVQIYHRNGTDAQKWKLESTGDGWYKIVSQCNNEFCLEVKSGDASDGARIQVYGNNDTDAQRWGFVENELGQYKIVSKLDYTKVLDVKGGGTQDKTGVRLYTYNATNAQLWNLVECD